MINDWNKSIKTGKLGENIVKDNFISLLKQMIDTKNINLTHILYETNPLIQKNGIDFIFNITFSKLEIKTRNHFSYQYNDILLETISIIEKNMAGWLYTSKSDIIVYAWLNGESTEFIDGYFLFLDNTRKYIKNKKYAEKIATTNKNGTIWHTKNIVVPIKELRLNNCIKRINFDIIYNRNTPKVIDDINIDKQVRFI